MAEPNSGPDLSPARGRRIGRFFRYPRRSAYELDNRQKTSRSIPRNRIKTQERVNKRIKTTPPSALALDCVRDLAFDLARARTIDIAIDFLRALDRAHIRARARDLDRAYAFEEKINFFNKIAEAITSSRPGEVLDLIEKILSTDLQAWERRLVTLLYDAVRCAVANTFVERRQTSRDLAIGLLEYAYEGLLMSEQSEQPWWRPWWQRWWQRLSRPWKKDLEIEKLKQDVLDDYWFLRMVRMREQGKLSAWEGIRLVREDKEFEE